MLKFKIIQKEHKPLLTLEDTKFMDIIKSINDLDCSLSFEIYNHHALIDIDKMFINLEDCIDTENPFVLTTEDIKHVLVTLKKVEHKGFSEFLLFEET
jgi:hypothetical protein